MPAPQLVDSSLAERSLRRVELPIAIELPRCVTRHELISDLQCEAGGEQRDEQTQQDKPKDAAAPVALSRTIVIRLRTFHVLQKPQVRLGQAVGTRSLTEQRDVADRRIAVTLIAVSNVSHGAHRSAVLVLYLEP